MGSLSVSTLRPLVHWQGLLLVVSLLNFWCLPSTALEDVLFRNAAEGENVLLPTFNLPPDTMHIHWYRGAVMNSKCIIAFLTQTSKHQIRGPLTGRVTITSDGSLLLKKVTKKDAGIYTIAVERQNVDVLVAHVKLSVYRRVRMPTLQASNTTVTVNKDAVVLMCNTNALSIQWLLDGIKLLPTERMKFSPDHRSLTIDPVKKGDAGIYQCEASNPISYATSLPLQLDVKFK